MTSSNGNIFRVSCHMCGEFTGPRWISRTKASDAELWCFFFICARINDWVNNGEAGDLRRIFAHYDVIVMLVIDWDRSVSRDVQPYSKYSYITHHGLCCLHANNDHTQLGCIVFMSIYNVDTQQRQMHIALAKLCYTMSVSDKLSYLLVSIMLLSQDRSIWYSLSNLKLITIILAFKFKTNNIAFTIKDSIEGQS